MGGRRWLLGGAAVVLGSSGLIVPTPTAAAGSPYEYGFVKPVARISPDGSRDLDGDGRGDLLVIKGTHQLTGTQPYRVTALRGVDGDRLWSRKFESRHGSGASVMRLGPHGRAGVLVETVPPGEDRWRLLALNGRTGETRWTYRFRANYHSGGPHVASPYLVGTGDKPTRYLTVDGAGRLVVLAGKDGDTWDPAPEADLAIGSSHITPVGDVDRDGYADIGAVGPAGLRVFSSTTGELLWTQVDVTAPTYISVGGDATGDGVPDLLVLNQRLIDGASGTELFSVSDRGLRPLGDINGDGLSDFLNVVDDYPDDNEDGPVRSVFVRVTALLSPDADVAWRRTVKAPDPAGPSDNWVGYRSTVEVNGDGITDVLLARDTDGNRRWAVIRGKSGSLRQTDRILDSSLEAAVDANGEDFWHANHGDIRVIDGRRFDVIMSPRNPWLSERTTNYRGASAARLTKDRFSELVLYWTDHEDRDVHVKVYGGKRHEFRWKATL